MISEENHETRLAVAGSVGILDSVSHNGFSDVQGNSSTSVSSRPSSLVNSESVPSQITRIDYGQLKRTVELVKFVNLLLLAFGAIITVLLLVGCSGKQSVNNVLDNASYAGELDKCKESGKDAGSYSVYEKCAKEVDTKFGRTGEK